MIQGKLHLRFHPGQTRAWRSTARFLLVLAGTRSGKTSWSPWWLHREVKAKGPGDYLLCAPTFKLLDKAAVPYLSDALGVKLGLGKLVGGAQGRFEVSKRGEWSLWGAAQDRPTRVVFGHADEPDSLEAAQYKGAVCDEAGQKKFKQESWEAIQRRLAIDQGRALFPTTPYSLNWLKTEIHDRAKRYADAYRKGLPFNAVDADYDCVNFVSIDNPAFPLDEWERAKATLPRWRFDLFYRGIFTRPAGAVYDCFDPETMVVPDFMIPPEWPRTVACDFGAPNWASLFIAENPADKKLYVYREYRPLESKTMADHIRAMRQTEGECRRKWGLPWTQEQADHWLPGLCVGGAKAEGQWRLDMAAAGWPVHEPDQPSVENQIARAYAAFVEGTLFITDTCPMLISDVQTISRPVDESGMVLDGIDDEHLFHSAAALRYGISYLRRSDIGLFAAWV